MGGQFFFQLGPGISPSAQTPPKSSKSRFCRNKLGESPQRCQSRKFAQHERGSDEPKHSQKLAGGSELQPKRIFVSWVPNRQNQCPTDEMAPQHPPKRPYPRPQGHMGPETGFTGSAFSTQTNLVARRFAQNGT